MSFGVKDQIKIITRDKQTTIEFSHDNQSCYKSTRELLLQERQLEHPHYVSSHKIKLPKFSQETQTVLQRQPVISHKITREFYKTTDKRILAMLTMNRWILPYFIYFCLQMDFIQLFFGKITMHSYLGFLVRVNTYFLVNIFIYYDTRINMRSFDPLKTV